MKSLKVSKNNYELIIDFVKENPNCSSNKIHEYLKLKASYSTVKRILKKQILENLIEIKGTGKSTKYSIGLAYELLHFVDMNQYFKKEIDERKIKNNFNFLLLKDTLFHVNIFSEIELDSLNALQNQHKKNIKKLTKNEYHKALERLAIDFSWKSSQIEGNTYSLLETEILLLDKKTASGKTRDEATMLINHKDTIDYIIREPNFIVPLTVSKIESLHALLVKELNINKNIRKRKVGISGTNYTPIDNEFQIREALEDFCKLINSQTNVFVKALIALVFISYIQPFSDGNKRTARILSNAFLIHHNYCPISFRTVNSIDYKKAILIFYEQNNITAFKKVFMDQFEFAVKTYF